MQKVTSFESREAINVRAHRKEDKFGYSFELCAVQGGKIKEIASLRIYNTASRNYACFWLNFQGVHCNGSAFAGGGGYHRPSAAAGALRKAGFKFSEGIDGRGDQAIRDALIAIFNHLSKTVWIGQGYEIKNPKVIKAHG